MYGRIFVACCYVKCDVCPVIRNCRYVMVYLCCKGNVMYGLFVQGLLQVPGSFITGKVFVISSNLGSFGVFDCMSIVCRSLLSCCKHEWWHLVMMV